MGRKRKIDGDIQEIIESLLFRGWAPAQVHRYLKKESKYKERAPTLRSVQRMKKALSPHDPSGPWGLQHDEEADPALVLPVLAAVIEETEGRKTQLTRAEAEWIARIRKVAPDLRLWTAYIVAVQYMLTSEHGNTTELDAFLAFAPWRDGAGRERHHQAIAKKYITGVSSSEGWPPEATDRFAFPELPPIEGRSRP